MNHILYTNNEVEYSSLFLDTPKRIKGGAFYSKLFYKDRPITLQTTICRSKHGLVETNKKKYIDLLFKENKNTIIWLQQLEKHIKSRILEHNDTWFSSSMEEDDIEEFFSSSFRKYKGEQSLVRCYVKEDSKDIKIFDEQENVLEMKDIQERDLICILQFDGIKITNTSISLHPYIKQILILEKEEQVMKKCLINKKVLFSDTPEKKDNNIPVNKENETSENKEDELISVPEDLEEHTTTSFPEMEECTDTLIPQDASDVIKLKEPNKVYYDMYKDIRKRIKYAKKLVVEGYLEARRIKKLYLLDELENESSDEEEDMDNLSNASTEELVKYNEELNKYL